MGQIARMSPVIVVIQEPNAVEGVLFAPLSSRSPTALAFLYGEGDGDRVSFVAPSQSTLAH